MSYDLTFWKQKPACVTPPQHIYTELMEGRAVDGVEMIPTTDFLARVHDKFPGITKDGGLVCWDGGKRGSFELYWSGQHVHFCCRQLSGDDMNVLVDIAVAFDCRLYDPQTRTRYDGNAA